MFLSNYGERYMSCWFQLRCYVKNNADIDVRCFYCGTLQPYWLKQHLTYFYIYKKSIQYHKTSPIVWRWIFRPYLLLGTSKSMVHFITIQPILIKDMH